MSYKKESVVLLKIRSLKNAPRIVKLDNSPHNNGASPKVVMGCL